MSCFSTSTVRSLARPLGLCAFSIVALAGCTQTASTPSAQAVPAGASTAPAGAGCAAEIARFRAVLKNDVDTGNLGQSVYNRATADLGRGEAACAAGREAEGLTVLASTKSRFGYR